MGERPEVLTIVICLVVAALTPLGCVAATGDSKRPPSLCQADEQVIFSCISHSRGKTASLCASRSLRSDRGYIVYRFGHPGRVELEYPDQHAGSRLKFRFAHYSRPLVDRFQVTFENGSYHYALCDFYEEENGKPQYERGVEVTRVDDERDPGAFVSCKSATVFRLQTLEHVIPCDKGNALAWCRGE